MKLIPKIGDNDGTLWGYAFYCPGCEHAHIYYVHGPVTWEVDLEKLTATPSLKNTCPDHTDPAKRCCHLNLTDGKLFFHGDSTHALKGQTVDLPDWPY